jgi:methyl-accepting chemotaxis protein
MDAEKSQDSQLIELAQLETVSQKAFARRIGVIANFALVLTVLAGLGAVYSLILVLAQNAFSSIITTTIALIVFLLAGLSYFLAKRNYPDQAAYLLVLITLGGTCGFQIFVVSNGLLSGFILVPILAALLGLRVKQTQLIAIITGVMLAIVVLLKANVNIFAVTDWLIVYSLAAVGILIFTQRMAKATLLSEEQNEKLRQLLLKLSATTQASTSLSRELSNITIQLDKASQHQAGSTQAEAASIAEITTSMEELNESANRIAANTAAVTVSADEAVVIASQVKESSQLVQASASQGVTSVEQTIASVQKMRDNIEQLATHLTHLTEQTSNVTKIVDLINGFAEETHLLALNASIEAAGNAGSSSSGESMVGARFGVIAMEVKNLADRSQNSTKEIRTSIIEMQKAVAAAVLTVEEGRKETSGALECSLLSGDAIQKLTEVISASYQRADQILQAAEEVRTHCDEIRLASRQQHTANRQILANMHDIANLSQESASSVTELAEMSLNVNKQVEELNLILNLSQP